MSVLTWADVGTLGATPADKTQEASSRSKRERERERHLEYVTAVAETLCFGRGGGGVAVGRATLPACLPAV